MNCFTNQLRALLWMAHVREFRPGVFFIANKSILGICHWEESTNNFWSIFTTYRTLYKTPEEAWEAYKRMQKVPKPKPKPVDFDGKVVRCSRSQ